MMNASSPLGGRRLWGAVALIGALVAAMACEDLAVPPGGGENPPPDKEKKQTIENSDVDDGPPTESWMDVGGSALGFSNRDLLAPRSASQGVGKARQACVEIGRDGTAYVAWATDNPRFDEKSYLYARAFREGEWQAMGSGAEGAGLGYAARVSRGVIAMAVDPGGLPVVLWEDKAFGLQDIYLKRWNGSGWAGFGPSRDSGRLSRDSNVQDPDFALDSRGYPVVVAERQGKAKPQISMLRWDGSAWVELSGRVPGAAVTAVLGARSPRVAVDAKDQVWVAWFQEIDAGTAVHLKYWDGGAWKELGGSATGTGLGSVTGAPFTLDLAMDPEGRPWIALTERNSLTVKRWDGSSWVLVPSSSGDAVDEGVTSSAPRVQLRFAPDGAPWVLWNRTGNKKPTWHTRRWNGADWIDMGSAGGKVGEDGGEGTVAGAGCLAFTARSEALLGWIEGNEAYVKTLRDGKEWTWLVGPPLESLFSPVRGGRRDAGAVALAVDRRKNPVVAWTESAGTGDRHLYVSSWDGASWLPLGKGALRESAAGDNVQSIGPLSVDIGEDGFPVVAWTESTTAGGAVGTRSSQTVQSLRVGLWDGAEWRMLARDALQTALNRADHSVGSLAVRAGKGKDIYVVWLDGYDRRAQRRGEDLSAADEFFIRDDYDSAYAEREWQVFLLKWDGSAWTEPGGGASAEGVSAGEEGIRSLTGLGVLPDGNPVIAWSVSDAVRVWGWNGKDWIPFGGRTATTGPFGRSVEQAKLVMDGEGFPVLLGIVEDLGYNKHVLARRWRDESWEVVEPLPEGAERGTTGGGGIAGSVGVGDVGGPEGLGKPVGVEFAWVRGAGPLLLWQTERGRSGEIRGALRSELAWRDLGGSLSETGISHSVNESRSPAAAVRGRSVFVAWIDATLVKPQVLLRKFVLP